MVTSALNADGKPTTAPTLEVTVLAVPSIERGFYACFLDNNGKQIESKGYMLIRLAPNGTRVTASVTGEFLVDADVKAEAYKLYECFLER